MAVQAPTLPRLAELDEGSLLRRCQDGDLEAFGQVVAQYKDGVFRLVYRITGDPEDAKDLTQDCFLRVYRQLSKYDPTKPFRPWLYRVATNLALNWIQERQRTCTELPEHEQADLEGPEAAVIDDEERHMVLRALNALPTPLRLVMVLRYVEDLSYKEIAGVLCIPIGTVATRIKRAIETLREQLERHYTKVGYGT